MAIHHPRMTRLVVAVVSRVALPLRVLPYIALHPALPVDYFAVRLNAAAKRTAALLPFAQCHAEMTPLAAAVILIVSFRR